ncbi:acyl-CoA dehydrogenase family protein [Hyphomicrobiales bacterium]|jgi:alkylation response protein AidB-like acyl-CoA dehydrogenase|nr:acyl-CoA dehydrogenase family protein [Hyphomicrobiales bacterium]MDA9903912.1 acyl-CoA dehydrogenase family protein [Hyphomicrobiales bacterium]MDB4247084.1 acyl-CoA dehydrogenase family protein [Hyphomicrobiales bacterium]MDB9926901.1 acyl-CoA dehydrogenase family protein [Hyphomicrobiales bacterium]|tara:strand:- start:1051 stop:2196 length:1146 start_codon:yes stop_codon:yes gene_type:complete
MNTPFNFHLTKFSNEAEILRSEVREFLIDALKDIPKETRAETWYGADENFSKKVGEKGWIGLNWPKEFGGAGRTSMERYVILEEMLTAGAPVGAHWISDRQSGPLIIRYGTEKHQKELLPGILKGESYFCIGMSEPDSGSDLAALRTKAEKKDNVYIVNGTKLWTSGAHRCQYMIACFRTSQEEDRHGGLSQFIVDLSLPGVTIRPIIDLAGRHHFNEVIFEDTEVPADMLIGTEGNGWNQVTAELALERSGPERYLSSYILLQELVNEFSSRNDDEGVTEIGRQMAHLTTLRQMSVSVAGMLDEGANPALEASVVKDLGAVFEQDLPNIAHRLMGLEPDANGSDFQRYLAILTQISPSFSLRGGTREILRGIIARGLGLR